MFAITCFGINMADLKPYGGTSQQRLVDLINEDNGSNLVHGRDFTFEEGVQDYSDPNGRNSKIKLVPVPGTSYKDDAMVFYRRLPITVLEELPPGFTKTVEIDAFPFTTHQIIDRINTALGLDLVTSEIEDIGYDNRFDTYKLTIVSGSLAWVESTFNFKARLPSDPVEIEDEVTRRDLDGLEYIVPQD